MREPKAQAAVVAREEDILTKGLEMGVSETGELEQCSRWVKEKRCELPAVRASRKPIMTLDGRAHKSPSRTAVCYEPLLLVPGWPFAFRDTQGKMVVKYWYMS